MGQEGHRERITLIILGRAGKGGVQGRWSGKRPGKGMDVNIPPTGSQYLKHFTEIETKRGVVWKSCVRLGQVSEDEVGDEVIDVTSTAYTVVPIRVELLYKTNIRDMLDGLNIHIQYPKTWSYYTQQ